MEENTIIKEENTIVKEENTIIKEENTIMSEEESNNHKNGGINISSFYDFTYELRYPKLNDDINNLDASNNNHDILEKYDMLYREDLLLVFKLGMALSITQDINSVLDSCTKCIEYLYENYKENKQITDILSNLKKVILLPFEVDNKTLFMYLFSIDYFYIFNECLKQLYYDHQISELTFNKLIDKINEK